jgi:hypothetical protein
LLGKIEEEYVEQRGSASFIDVESGGGPVHALCPTQMVAKPGGANRSTEIILK